jgi:hypothetical protein
MGARIVVECENCGHENWWVRGRNEWGGDLFYNTPARLKFLKRDLTENSKSMDWGHAMHWHIQKKHPSLARK